ncbi:MAG: patatin-like phospholipase family protein [Alphaproteobacteria bacterium]|nr:patatin-like phospholipase family protein [Alphaproteobacteria bacterium]
MKTKFYLKLSKYTVYFISLFTTLASGAIEASSASSSEESGSSPKKTAVIFTIDGGGTRGIMPAVMLDALQRKLGSDLAPKVHVWGGASIGGIEAMMLNVPSDEDPKKPKYSPKDLIDLMPLEGSRIFPKSWYNTISSGGGLWAPHYPSSGIEDVAHQYFGDTYLSQSLSNVIISGFDLGRNTPIFFKSANAKTNEDIDFHMRDVARLTSSAQTYFPVAQIQSKTGRTVCGIDGGNICNNITMSAIVEARQKFSDVTDWLVVNFGTGRVVKTVDYDTIQNKGMLYWVKPTISITMDGVSAVVDYQLNELLPPVELGDGYFKRRYYRFQPTIPESLSALDSIENLPALRMIAENFVQEHDSEFTAIAEELNAIFAGKTRESRLLSPMLSHYTTERSNQDLDELSTALSSLQVSLPSRRTDQSELSDDSGSDSESTNSLSSSLDSTTDDEPYDIAQEDKVSEPSTVMLTSFNNSSDSSDKSEIKLGVTSIQRSTSPTHPQSSPRALLPSLSSPRFDSSEISKFKVSRSSSMVYTLPKEEDEKQIFG